MATKPRTLVGEVLVKKMINEVWSSSYGMALPITFEDFDIASVLPAVFYMSRFGRRRGNGGFLDAFAPNQKAARGEKRQAVDVDQVASKLAKLPYFKGFDGETPREILGDLLLCHCLGNKNYKEGRNEVILRVAPTHLFSSWIDLPERASNLRFVPEMIVALLANQEEDKIRWTGKDEKDFPIGMTHKTNPLLRAFSQGVTPAQVTTDLAGDKFDEQCPEVGIDQLLTIRMAQCVGKAPDYVREWNMVEISNQHPISERATQHFSEDLRRFVQSYWDTIPRHTFVDLLESCISVGLGTILTSVGEMILKWSRTGQLPERLQQRPASLFVDCSNGIDKRLRRAAEDSFDDLLRRLEHLPSVLMTLRLLDYSARDNRRLKGSRQNAYPYATKWLNLLGKLLHNRHPESKYVSRTLEETGEKLAEVLEKDYPDEARVLRNVRSEANPIRRLATALTLLQGRAATQKLYSVLNSSLNVGRPNGLAMGRRTSRGTGGGSSKRKLRRVRSLVLSDATLDYLVHLHLPRGRNTRSTKVLSFLDFLKKIRNRYGFYVDTAPDHMDISNELLHLNRIRLEQRLRDLGLLVGVNDAESMKRLKRRFN